MVNLDKQSSQIRLITPLIPESYSHRSPWTKARLFLWGRSRAEGSPPAKNKNQGWHKHPHFLLQTHKSHSPLLSNSSGRYYSVMRKARKLLPQGTMRYGTEYSALQVKQHKSLSSCWCCQSHSHESYHPTLDSCLLLTIRSPELPGHPSSPELSPAYSSVHCLIWIIHPPHTIYTTLTFWVIRCHQQNAFIILTLPSKNLLHLLTPNKILLSPNNII